MPEQNGTSKSSLSSFRKLARFAATIIQPISEFIYPPFCLLCDSKLASGESRICSHCWNSFHRMEKNGPAYIDLHRKFSDTNLVADCLAPFLFEQEGRLQEVIHHLKYQGFTSLGFRLGEEIGRQIIETETFLDADFLVPVPLHRLKFRERGYNQCEYLCKGISSITNLPVQSKVLKRIKYTVTQTQLDIAQREENVDGAFRAPKRYRDAIEGKAVIIVDDVITTGATMRSCARELIKYGAEKVFSVSIAHAY